MAKSRDLDAVGQALTLAARRHRAYTAILLSEIEKKPLLSKIYAQRLIDELDHKES